VTLLAELKEFVSNHRPHGALTTDATEPAWNGYLLTGSCLCGVTFGRWVTPQDAELDLLHAADECHRSMRSVLFPVRGFRLNRTTV
jgi:hypothetical protein